MEVMKKYKISAQYLENYACYAKKHRDMGCEYHCNSKCKKISAKKEKLI